MFEASANKTCGGGAAMPFANRKSGEQHVYRVLVSEQPGVEGVRVRFGADLAVMCSCAMRAAGLLKTAPRAEGVYHAQEADMSAALSFAQDAEYELVLMPNCGWQFCDLKSSSVCRDCGLRVHRREPMGKFLLERTREQVQDEAERREREAAREAERRDRERKRARIEARREAERLER
jgi:hypothetical protein